MVNVLRKRANRTVFVDGWQNFDDCYITTGQRAVIVLRGRANWAVFVNGLSIKCRDYM